MTKPYRSLLLLAALVSLVGCDHATKYVAKAGLEARPAQAVVEPFLNLRYVENTDVAFNLLSFVPEGVRFPLLLALGAIAIVSLLTLLVRVAGRAGARAPLQGYAVAGLLLATAGALGNYLDRLVRGYVVDFIHVSYWPVFNVADVLICVGLGLLAIHAARPRDRAAT